MFGGNDGQGNGGSAISRDQRIDAGAHNGSLIGKHGSKKLPEKAGDSVVPVGVRDPTEPFENGYHFPPSHSWGQAFRLGGVAFAKYCMTPLGFFVVLYGLLVVAWGGMLFLLLCNASPAMCYPSCDDIDSPRRKWIEWDSQIVNALFCVTGFGLAPWRFRDLYYLLRFRVSRDPLALRRLAGIHRGWFRLPGSDRIPVTLGPADAANPSLTAHESSIPVPVKSMPEPPLSGTRAPGTATWKLDFVIWFNVSNTFLQCVLSGFMWGMTRFNRPSWAVGLFVALACGAAGVGGYMMFKEGSIVKSIEGVPVSREDQETLAEDARKGTPHYNNIKDKAPKQTRRAPRRWRLRKHGEEERQV